MDSSNVFILIILIIAFGAAGAILEMIFINTIWNIKESFWSIE